jgi:tetratricopeptide (TPR) repeat protein
MATRVNKKLLIIVLSCSAIAIGVVSAVAVQQWRQDPTRFLKAGDAAMARNDYREAARNYGRAIGKRPNELAFHSKYIDAAAKVVPASADEAGESYLLWVGSLLKRAQIARNDEKLWREVLEERFFQSEVNESVTAWQRMHDVAAIDMLEGLDPSEPLAWTAKTVMGYAQSRRYGALSPEEISSTITLLESALEKVTGADRDLAYAGLLNIRFEQASRLGRAGQSRQSAESWKVFDDLYAKAAAEVPEGFHLTELGLLRLRTKLMANDPAVQPEMLATAADTLISRAVALGTRSAIFEAVKGVGSPAVPQGLEKAAAMLRDYLAKNPNEILHRRALAVCLEGFDIAEAAKEAQAIIDAPQLPVSLASAAQSETRVRAAQQMFDLDFERLYPTSGETIPEAQRLEMIKKLESSSTRIRELAAGMADDSPVLKTEGMVAFAKRDFNVADQKFKEVFRKGSLIDDLQLYVLASAVAEERGETGQAQQLVNKGLEKAPGSLILLERNGRLALRNGRFAEAKNFAEQILAKEPENKQAQNLRRAAEDGEHPMMIDPNDPVIQQVKKADDLRTEGKFDESRAVLNDLLAKYPDSLPGLIVALSLEYDTKNNERALEFAERALKLSPGNPNVTRLRSLIVGGDDPVARVVAQVSVERPNEPDRTIFTAIRLAQTEASVRQRAASLETSDPTEADRLKGLLAGITPAAAEWRTKAAALDPLNPAWLDFLFSGALLEKKFDVAEQIITDAERSGRSPATVSLFRGRLALTQGRAGEAVALLQKSIDANVDDSDVFRLLGIAYEQSGDLQSALKNYAEAYRRKPTDLTPGKVYASALVRAGDRSNALSILRELRKIAPSDEDLMETWLDVESEIGDRRLARSVRKARYDLVPGERRNAIKFATMMAEAQPEREDISDAGGRTKYTEAAWRALEDRARQQEINRRRTEWQAESDRIYDQLIAAEPLSMELALIRAATYRRQGRADQAEQALRGLITRAGASATPEMYVALGIHFVESGNQPKATETFAEAVRLQSDATRNADAAIADYYFQKFQWEKAIGHLERLAEAVAKKPTTGLSPAEIAKRRELNLRLAETYARVGKFDQAKAALTAALNNGPRDLIFDQLDGSISEARGTALLAAGNLPEALKAFDEGLASLANAAKTAPYNPTIAVQQASLYSKKFEATGDRSALAAGMAAADRGTRMRGDYWPASQAKAELLIADGKRAEAVVELERFTKAAPSNPDGRRRLISLLAGIGNANRAIEVAREAIQLTPNDPAVARGAGRDLPRQQPARQRDRCVRTG